jgi:peptidoglycan-N-acetylglucosamine deacetylase
MERAHNPDMMDLSSKAYRYVFPSVTFSTSNDAVHLTFDDGPNTYATPEVLNILNKFRVKATFFLLGHNVQQSPELVREIFSDGHSIGNHSFSHKNLLLRRKTAIRQEIITTNEGIRDISGVSPTMFRPPFGFFDLRTLNIVSSLAMRLVHWSNDLRDFEVGTTEKSIANLIRRIDKGSIVLLHDNDATSDRVKTILPMTITMLRDRGLAFSSLD